MFNKAFGYAYISTEEEEKGNYPSWQRQAEEIEDYVKKLGFKKWTVFHDEPIEPAGPIDCSLGGIFNLLDEIIRQKVYFVVVTSLDRLQRPECKDTNFYAELIRRNKHVLTVGEEFTLYSPGDFSETYNDEFSTGEVRYGRHQSGPVPYGYKKDGMPSRNQKIFITPDPQEAEVVKMIFEEYEKTKSFAAVQRFLEGRKIKTRRKHEWSRAGLSWLLKNDIYLGVSRSSPDEEPKESHRALIGQDLYDRVQTIIKKRQRKRKKKGEF